MTEKTSKKLLPIYLEILRKVSTIEKKKDKADGESDDIDGKPEAPGVKKGKIKKAVGGPKNSKPIPCDLRHILGFLNQTEWIQNLNIGNIMQISPITMDELLRIRRNEECLGRDFFLEVISFLVVGYFCASTEIRFIIQLKDEISKFKNFSIPQKTNESELWHTLSLEIACSFLPSDCPLFNHILLSY